MKNLTANAMYVLQTIDIMPQDVCVQDLVAITGQDDESRTAVSTGLSELIDMELVSRANDPDIPFDQQPLHLTAAGQDVLRKDDERFSGRARMMPLAALVTSEWADDLLDDGIHPDDFKSMLKGEA